MVANPGAGDAAIEPRLSLVTLGVGDLPRAIAFYEALGWRRSVRAAEGVAFFPLGPGVVLSLFPRKDLAADAGLPEDGGAKGFRGAALAHNCRSREAVDAAVAAWRTAGGQVVKAPEDAPWGGYAGYVADPDGHLWEIAWNPHFPLDAEGRVSLPD